MNTVIMESVNTEKKIKVKNTEEWHHVKPLSDVIAFEFKPFITRLAKEKNIDKIAAKELNKDMLKFLYICAAFPEERPLFPPLKIDEAWHIFLLFTKQYANFCNHYFGRFLHHAPISNEMRKLRSEGMIQTHRAVELATNIFGEVSENCNVIGDCEQSCCPDYD